MKKFIILGAGPCGLAAAFGLAKNNINVDVYEGRDAVGGLGGSEEVDGMFYDYGPHIYHTHDPEMKKFWLENFGDLLVQKEFFAKNHKDGILYDYPLSEESIEKFPEKIKKKVKKELKELNPENVMRAQNFKEVVTAIVGPTLQYLFFETYPKKLWGIPTHEMSANWAPKRIKIRKKHSSFWYNQFSAAGKKGSGAIMNRMADRIKEKNNIYLNHQVSSFKFKDNKINSIIFSNKKEIEIKDEIIISTLPVTTTAEFLGYKSSLQFNSYILAYVIVDQKEVFPKEVHSIYFAHDENYFHRVSEQKKYSDYNYPKDKSILVFEISYRTKPHLINEKPENLAKEVFKQFCDMGFSKMEYFSKGFTRVFPCINPIMTLGYELELSKTTSVIHQMQNIYSVGGAAEFSYGDMQVMFAKAKDTVELFSSSHYMINKNIKMSRPFKFNTAVKVGEKTVGEDQPPLLIAEIGINHQGSQKILMELLEEVKKSGCDYAKIQSYAEDSRVSKVAKSAKYADKTLEMEENMSEMFERLRLNEKQHDLVFDWSKKNKLPLISTAFDETSCEMLMKYNPDAFKIASFDAVNLPLIKFVASKKKPIILSTGMCGMSEIEEALDVIASQDNKNVMLLHCVSVYPTDTKDVNLKAMTTMKNAFKVPTGYSDHTIGNTISNAALAMGANVIEKHFTLNKDLEGSDHALSADVKDLNELVKTRDTIFTAMGSGVKKATMIESLAINAQRKSIFTRTKIMKGETITLENVTIKGPGHGLMPKYLDLVLGKKVTKNIDADSPITWDEILSS
jgi:sialic acid synthase SpsE/protoporphyrinogen oxidase|tara:strand:+ start:5414 stop:7789 length:2376 start_codon:yes stop_codon:yes gene_type:complete